MAKKPEQNNGALQMLKSQIKEKCPGRLYFFHGEETFLLHYYLDQLRKLLVDDLTESFNFHKLNSETFDLQEFAGAVENLPMMAEYTMVWVDEIDFFRFAEADRDRFIEIISDIPEYCTVVFSYVTTEWKPDKRLKKLWDAVEKYGLVVEFAKQEQRELVNWVTRHFAANQKRITPDLCVYLIDITGGTMTALAGEISKICAYSEAMNIVKADIDAVTEPVLDAVVFQIGDLLGRGQYGMAMVKLREVLKMQEEPLTILGAIGSHFRRLSTARTLVDNGRPVSEVMQLTKSSEYIAKKNIEAARKFSAGFYEKAAQLLLETDWQLKNSYDDPQRLLEILILKLAQEAKNG